MGGTWERLIQRAQNRRGRREAKAKPRTTCASRRFAIEVGNVVEVIAGKRPASRRNVNMNFDLENFFQEIIDFIKSLFESIFGGLFGGD
jgi:hypothetical protein